MSILGVGIRAMKQLDSHRLIKHWIRLELIHKARLLWSVSFVLSVTLEARVVLYLLVIVLWLLKLLFNLI